MGLLAEAEVRFVVAIVPYCSGVGVGGVDAVSRSGWLPVAAEIVQQLL